MKHAWVALICVLAVPAHASKLGDVQAQLAAEKKHAATTEREAKEIQGSLDELRDALVTITRDVQSREKARQTIEAKKKKTNAAIALAEKELDRERKSLANMIMAFQRLDRLPPSALLARPSAPIDTARSYALLEDVLPRLADRAAAVRRTLDRLAILREKNTRQEKALNNQMAALRAEQKKLQDAIAQRRRLYNQTAQAYQDSQRKARQLAARARDLRDLVDGLRAPSPSRTDSVKQSMMAWFSRGAQMPVIGRVETGYGDRLPGGGTSRGLRIAAADEAVVTAPLDGTVKFAGPFRQYRILVILQHGNGDHSLLGGLGELYTRVGEKVVAGEPIGKLSGDSMAAASLYYERRSRGKAIDPRKAR